MKARIAFSLALALCAGAASAAGPKVVSQRTIWGFVNPESVGCDAEGGAVYVSNFGSPQLDPGKKDGKGYVSKLSLQGRLIEDKFLPAKGAEPLNKPKGLWIRGGRLWLSDVDAVWEFDLKTRRGRKLPLPGVAAAGDTAIWGDALYVADAGEDLLMKVEPAEFLDAKIAPRISVVAKGRDANPGALWPAKDKLLMAGFKAEDHLRAVWALDRSGKLVPISIPIGRLDGLYEMKDGALLATDWDTGSLFAWTTADGASAVATGFKGPADFCVLPGPQGHLTVYAPDLVQSQVRIIELAPAK